MNLILILTFRQFETHSCHSRLGRIAVSSARWGQNRATGLLVEFMEKRFSETQTASYARACKACNGRIYIAGWRKYRDQQVVLHAVNGDGSQIGNFRTQGYRS